MKQMEYKEARKLMKPGDVIAFSGKSFLSSVIQDVTGSPVSHVGVIMQTDISDGIFVNQIIESNGKKKGMTGVRVWRMSERVEEYDGSIWWLPMFINFDRKKFVGFCLSQVGKKYDAPQAIGSALHDQEEDISKLICSELVSAALEHAGILKNINASKMTPADVVAFDIYRAPAQIKGDAIFLSSPGLQVF
jgi:hypothetical protein